MKDRRYRPLRRDLLSQRQVTRPVRRHPSLLERKEGGAVSQGGQRTLALAKGGIDRLGDNHRYTAAKAITTVKLAEHLVTSESQPGAGTAAKKKEFQRLTRAYLVAVYGITAAANQEVIRQLIEELANGRLEG